MAKKVERGLWYVGADSEGGNATLQLSSIQGEDSKHVIFQLDSNIFGDCFADGVPIVLKEILTHPAIVFVGNQVRGDMRRIGEKCLLEEDVIDRMKCVETEDVVQFLFSLARGPAELERLVRTMRPDEELSGTSLEFFWHLAFPDKVMDKRGFHRDHRTRWHENRVEFVSHAGRKIVLKPKELGDSDRVYCVLDAVAAIRALCRNGLEC
jgi:hypothetical protein